MEMTRRYFFKIMAGIGGALALQGIDVLPESIAEALPKEEPRYSRRTIKVELINNGYTFYFPYIEMMGNEEKENSWVSVYMNDKPIVDMPCFLLAGGKLNIGLRMIIDRSPAVGINYLTAILTTEIYKEK